MEDSMRFIIPYYGPDGRIIYWSARSYSKLQDGPKYIGASGRHPLFVRTNWTPTKAVVVVEGALDALAVEEHTGLHVAALGGKYLSGYLTDDLLGLGTERLVLLLDSDALTDALKLRARLQTKRQVKIIPLPVGEDPASLGEQLKGLLC
jgi:DNA primase